MPETKRGASAEVDAQCDDREVTTIEGLSRDGDLHPNVVAAIRDAAAM